MLGIFNLEIKNKTDNNDYHMVSPNGFYKHKIYGYLFSNSGIFIIIALSLALI